MSAALPGVQAVPFHCQLRRGLLVGSSSSSSSSFFYALGEHRASTSLDGWGLSIQILTSRVRTVDDALCFCSCLCWCFFSQEQYIRCGTNLHFQRTQVCYVIIFLSWIRLLSSKLKKGQWDLYWTRPFVLYGEISVSSFFCKFMDLAFNRHMDITIQPSSSLSHPAHNMGSIWFISWNI